MLKASVIVPVYNVEKYLRRCVDSILVQTMPDFELILVDDGSTDESPSICDDYAKKDNRVKVIHKQNQGVSAARNDGLDAAKGEYILFVDSDDYVNERYVECLVSKDCDLSICGSIKILENGIEECFFSPNFCTTSISPQIVAQWFDHNYLGCVWGKAFRKQVIDSCNLRFNSEMNFGEDTLFAVKFAVKCKSGVAIPDTLYYYIKYPTGTLTKSLGIKSVVSFDLLDQSLQNVFSQHDIVSECFRKADYTSKRKFKWAFFKIYEDYTMSLMTKYKWYRLFFSLPTFNENIDLIFAEYPWKLRTLLKSGSAVAVLLFQIAANIYGKLRRK